MAEEQPQTADELLKDALALLNEQPRFTAQGRRLDSYDVAARISEYLRRKD